MREGDPGEALPTDVLPLLRSERARPEPSPEALDRLRGRIEATLSLPTPAGGAQGGDATPTEPVPSTAPPLAPSTVARAVSRRVLSHVLVFALGGGAGAALHATATRTSTAPPIVATSPATPPPATVPLVREVRAPVVSAPSEAASATPVPLEQPRPSVPASTPRTVVRNVGTAERSNAEGTMEPPSTLRAERAALDVARTALARGQTEAALSALEQHGQRFGHGQLAEERESLAVQALVSAGQYTAARSRAARFTARFPSSLFRPMVEASLRTIP